MIMATKCAINGDDDDDGDNDDDHSCVVMTIVVGLLHDNGHYRCHKGERPPLEAFIGSFLLHSLTPQCDQNFSLSCQMCSQSFGSFYRVSSTI